MKRIALKGIPLRSNLLTGWSARVHWLLFGAFAVDYLLVWSGLWMRAPWFGEARWPDGLLIVFATGTTLAWLARQLPAQNVMLAAIIIGFLAGLVESIAPLTGVPFGPFTFTKNIGQELFHPLPWAMPLLWLVIVLNARGVGRLVLRPWRKGKNYGLWLIGITAVLVVLFDLGLEPYATRVKHYWLWGASKTRFTWYSAPWVNFVGWVVTTIIILAFATPSLINKSPAKQPSSVDHFPLMIWLMLNVLFATGALVNQLWPAFGFVAGSATAVAAVGWRNGSYAASNRPSG
jgi:putative membrane protein